jgi:anti-sigma factor RsiW
MVERGHVFRRAFSWLPAQFASQSDAPIGAPRQFGSTEHLSTEAIAAFVDGELRMNAHLRAAHHISLCPECAKEVEDQRRARAALRDSHPIRIPSTLLGLLSQIPHSPPDDAAPSWPNHDAGRAESDHWGPPRTRGNGGAQPQAGGAPATQGSSPISSLGRLGQSERSDHLADGSPRGRRDAQ